LWHSRLCWGNTDAPHADDVPLKDIVDLLLLTVNAQAYSIEAANPRHAHEWEVWQGTKLPEGKILIPGVIDSVTTFVEHPDLVAQRIVQYANIVGRENVIAAPDCGFGTFSVWAPRVHPEIMWAKFGSLVEGARIASERLWGQTQTGATARPRRSSQERAVTEMLHQAVRMEQLSNPALNEYPA
jgi:5-methyltetrahydropteroyltriglutamate--homocysteine methyltransferase